jgi:hypothetical protein
MIPSYMFWNSFCGWVKQIFARTFKEPLDSNFLGEHPVSSPSTPTHSGTYMQIKSHNVQLLTLNI